MTTTLTIPAPVAAAVREGLFSLMGDATEGLDHALLNPGRERSPEWFEQDRQQLEDVFTLLDLIGWSADTLPTDTTLDLATHGHHVKEALDSYLPILEYQQQEAANEARQRAELHLPVRQRDDGHLVAVVREFQPTLTQRLHQLDAEMTDERE